MVALLVVLVCGWHPALRLPVQLPRVLTQAQRCSISCCDFEVWAKPDVSEVAADVEALLQENERRSEMIDSIFAQPAVILGEDGLEQYNPHIDERNELIGQVDSSRLLDLDEAAGLWPDHLELSEDPATKNMMFIDQLSCIGCRWCACVARSTFQMDDDDGFGTARVVQQGGDQADVVQEAIDVCPADCIHSCTRDELRTLEGYRGTYFDDMMASHQARGGAMGGASRGGDGGGRMAAPHWRDPLTHRGWEKGPQYVTSARLKMRTEEALLHKGGTRTDMCLFDVTAAQKNGARAGLRHHSASHPHPRSDARARWLDSHA